MKALNHVAVTVSPDLLTGEARAKVVDVFGRVMGLREYAPWAEDRKILAMYAGTAEQEPHDPGMTYLVFIGHDSPATANAGNMGDHYGVTCSTKEEWDECLATARTLEEEYDDFRIGGPEELVSDKEIEHRFYFSFGQPMACEVQFQELR
jgi:hypothetical protein